MQEKKVETITFPAPLGGYARTFTVPASLWGTDDIKGRYASLTYKEFCAVVGCCANKKVWDQPDSNSVHGAQMVWAKAHNRW